jgi:hypothetical protein
MKRQVGGMTWHLSNGEKPRKFLSSGRRKRFKVFCRQSQFVNAEGKKTLGEALKKFMGQCCKPFNGSK